MNTFKVDQRNAAVAAEIPAISRGTLTMDTAVKVKPNVLPVSRFFADAIRKLVDPEVAADPACICALLKSEDLFTMGAVAKGAYLGSATALSKILNKRCVIYRFCFDGGDCTGRGRPFPEASVWKPSPDFFYKDLFRLKRIEITSKCKKTKSILLLKATFKGACFIRALLSHPELEPLDIYFKTFPEEYL